MRLKYVINTITDVLISIKPQFRSKFFIFHKKMNKIVLFSKNVKIMLQNHHIMSYCTLKGFLGYLVLRK